MSRTSKALARALRKDRPEPKFESGLFGIGEQLLREHDQLVQLLRQYGIHELSESGLYQLALALARDYVPSFTEAKPRGQPKKWSVGAEASLCIRAQGIVDRDGVSKSEACRKLIDELPYCQMSIQWESLRQRLQTAQKKSNVQRQINEWISAALVNALL